MSPSSDDAFFGTLEEAKRHPDGIVVLEGDDGGQIYVVCPAKMVACSEETLERLLRDLDGIAWPGNDEAAARLSFERAPVGTTVPGGMGGGQVTGDLWVHDELVRKGHADAIRAVLEGRRARVIRPSLQPPP